MRINFILFTLFITKIITAQNITGIVTDSNEYPLEGVYVYNNNSAKHAHTKANGMFTLEESKAGDSIEVGMLGFHKKVIILTQSDVDAGLTIQLESKTMQLDQVVITRGLNAMHHIAKLDLHTSPVNSSQEVLRKIPGLIIGQHAGGGKAEQLFLRGFDIDHGTDINLSVDGMPVNMVSHAHGQGYSDFH